MLKILAKILAALIVLVVLIAVFNQAKIRDVLAQMELLDYELRSPGVPLPSSLLPDDAQWLELFDGKSLEGWTPKFTHHKIGKNLNDTFRAENGVLSVNFDNWESFDGQYGHLFYQQPFSRYVLQMEYRFVGNQVANPGLFMGWAIRNNGAMLHSQEPSTMTLDQDFPVSIEAQLLGGLGDGVVRQTANLCTPGTHIVINGKLHKGHCTYSVSPTFDGDQWVKAEFEVLGSDRIRHFINGELVMEYTDLQYDALSPDVEALGAGHSGMLSAGYIAIQAESHPTQFRNIRVHAF